MKYFVHKSISSRSSRFEFMTNEREKKSVSACDCFAFTFLLLLNSARYTATPLRVFTCNRLFRTLINFGVKTFLLSFACSAFSISLSGCRINLEISCCTRVEIGLKACRCWAREMVYASLKFVPKRRAI